MARYTAMYRGYWEKAGKCEGGAIKRPYIACHKAGLTTHYTIDSQTIWAIEFRVLNYRGFNGVSRWRPFD